MTEEKRAEIISALKSLKEHCDGELACSECAFESVCIENGIIPYVWSFEGGRKAEVARYLDGGKAE